MTRKKTERDREMARAFGADVRAGRQRRGWTQSQLARKLGDERNASISKYELGKSYPTPARRADLIKILGLTGAAEGARPQRPLVEVREEPAPFTSAPEGAVDRQAWSDLYEALTAAQRRLVLTWAQSLLAR